MITYDNLWTTLKNKNISIYKLLHEYGLSRGTMHSLKHNKSITTNTLDNLCDMLDCEPSDIISYTPNKKSQEE
jgi:DNA-binding Xre family transcriptional regulator